MFAAKFIFLVFLIGTISCFPQRSLNTNPDGSLNLSGKIPLNSDAVNSLSAIGGLEGIKDGGIGAASGGLLLSNIGDQGHSIGLTGRHLPDFGNQLTASGSLNLLDDGPHKLDAGAWVTRNFPTYSDPFTTGGGSLGYSYDDKIGATLGASNLGYSAMGNLNLMRDRDSSLDLFGGVSKSIGPYVPPSSWEPSIGLSYSKSW